MSREFKFRAWDKRKRCMQTVLEIQQYDDGSLGVHGEHCGRSSADFELMQFTGLKDKNGREIYEGDVVAHPNPRCFGAVKFGSYNFSDYDTSEIGTGFYIDRVDTHVQALADNVAERIDVIGNIYENPGLLEIKV